MRKLFNPSLTRKYSLPKIDTWPDAKHRFDDESCWAIEMALASGRPLLLRGEPGIGKSQLARSVAHVMKVPFLYHVVDERSERDDLLYSYDAVSRLAQAQLVALLQKDTSSEDWKDEVAEDRFIKPGPLWWAFDWESAQAQAKRNFRGCSRPAKPRGWQPVPETGESAICGPVVLIDEIDKADPSVPNGLLESLGNKGFQTAQLGRSIESPKGGVAPFIMITTNEERELPAAFLRRCIVLHMRFPPEGQSVEDFLLNRARVYCSKEEVSDSICLEIIESLQQDRSRAEKSGFSKPGAAEFLDLVKGLNRLYPKKEAEQREILAKVMNFVLKKNQAESGV